MLNFVQAVNSAVPADLWFKGRSFPNLSDMAEDYRQCNNSPSVTQSDRDKYGEHFGRCCSCYYSCKNIYLCFIVFLYQAYVVLRICVDVVVCFNGVEVVIEGVRRCGTQYINIGAGPNITYISNKSLSLGKMIHHMSYTPFKEVHLPCTQYLALIIKFIKQPWRRQHL